MEMKTYQLLEVPVADLHVAAVVVHALGELRRRAGAVVRLRLLRLLRGDGGRLGGRRGAAEHAADGVADRGADGHTTV